MAITLWRIFVVVAALYSWYSIIKKAKTLKRERDIAVAFLKDATKEKEETDKLLEAMAKKIEEQHKLIRTQARTIEMLEKTDGFQEMVKRAKERGFNEYVGKQRDGKREICSQEAEDQSPE